jgi:hypothetical protein
VKAGIAELEAVVDEEVVIAVLSEGEEDADADQR